MRIYECEPLRIAIGRYFPMAKCSRLNRASLHRLTKRNVRSNACENSTANGPAALEAPAFDFQVHFCHSAPVETHDSGPTPRHRTRGPNAISYQGWCEEETP